jgi:hypothetical protein
VSPSKLEGGVNVPIAGLLPTSLLEWGRIVVVAAFVALLAFFLGQCSGKSVERSRAAAARAEANVEAMATNAKATEAAAEQRVEDATEVAAQEEVLIDAIQSTPDTAPDAVRVRLGCERLRAQGTDPAAFPACR